MEILGKSILELQEAMDRGELNSKELVFFYLERIAKYDKSGIAVNSVAEINPDAIFIAEALDRERKLTGKRGPLHGIPVLIKDNINTGDKMRTTAGSVSLKDNIAKDDSPLVANLRKAGAVLLGKTNLSEFARYIATDTINGFSSYGGQVLNPYNINKDVSGSSSGSGVAASCEFATATIGTETEGSIVGPSIANGVVGLKPTVGVVSRAGIIPIAGQDTAGPMGRTVEDVAIVLSAIAGGDGVKDAATMCTDYLIEKDYTKFLVKNGLKGMRIGVNRGEYENLTEDKKKIFDIAIKDMETAGATIVENCNVPNVYGQFEFSSRPALVNEFRLQIDAYLAHYGNSKMRTMGDIIQYNNEHYEIALKYGQDIFIQAQTQTSGRLTDPEYIHEKIRILNKSQKDGIDRIVTEKNIDVLVCPGYSDLPPIAGYPVINVPAGFDKDDMPYGISFIGEAFQEGKILRAAYGYEQATHRRKAPDLDYKQIRSEIIEQSTFKIDED